MKINWPQKKKLHQALILIIVITTCVYFWLNTEILSSITEITLTGFALIIISKLLVSLLNAYKFNVAISIFGVRLKATEWFGLTSATTYYGYILPARTNTIPRAIYLKTTHDFFYKNYLFLLTGTNLLELISTLGIGIIFSGLSIPNALHFNVSTSAILSLIILIAFALLLLIFYLRNNEAAFRIVNKIIFTIKQQASFFTVSYKKIALYIVISSTLLFTQAASIYLCTTSLGYSSPFGIFILTSCLIRLSSYFTILPGNIGVTESILTGTLMAGGIPFEYSASTALLSRACSLIVQLPLGVYFSLLLFAKIAPPNYGKGNID